MERGAVGFLCDGPGSHRVGSRQASVHILTPPADSSQQEQGQGQVKHFGITEHRGCRLARCCSFHWSMTTKLSWIWSAPDVPAPTDISFGPNHGGHPHGLRGNNRLSLNESYRAKSRKSTEQNCHRA